MIPRYSICAEGDPHESELVITDDNTGEWVKFEDVEKALAQKNSFAPTHITCSHCGFNLIPLDAEWCRKCGRKIKERQ